jgi:hypothetical protein
VAVHNEDDEDDGDNVDDMKNTIIAITNKIIIDPTRLLLLLLLLLQAPVFRAVDDGDTHFLPIMPLLLCTTTVCSMLIELESGY